MKKVLALILVALMVFSLAACKGGETQKPGDQTTAAPGGDATEAPETGEKVLKIATDGEPEGLFSAYRQGKPTNRIAGAMYNYLVDWDDENKKPLPSVATSWEWIGDDYTKIRFTLRDDVYFTNGEKLVGEDVTESFKYNVQNHENYNGFLDCDNFVVEDDTHVVIAMKRPYSNLLDLLGCDYFTIFDWSAWQADVKELGEEKALTKWQRDPVGSGPYKLAENGWKSGESVTLVRNEKYWDKENAGYYDKIVFNFIGDPASRVNALKAGTVDVAIQLDASQVEDTQKAGLTVAIYEENVAQPLSFNMRNNPALADENIRKAVLYAVDKTELADAYRFSYGKESKNPLTGQASPYYTEIETFSQDLEVAKAAVEEAKKTNGWTDKDLTFTYWQIAGADASEAELLKYYCEQVGITLNIETADFAVVLFDHLFKGDSSIGLGENDNWDVIRMLNFVDNRVPSSWNAYVGEHEEELYKLIDTAKDSGKQEDYNKVMQFCVDHYVCSTVCNTMNFHAFRSDLTGIKYDAHCWPIFWTIHPAK